MRITKLTGITAALLSIAPIGLHAQSSGTKKNQAKSALIRADVRELPADQQIIHALNRMTFGPKPGDVLEVRAIGLDNWIDQQLHPEKIDDSTALVTDLDDKMDDVVILTMSEFGRMAKENGNRGTDHGHAGALFVIGGHVKGGKVHGKWPGLEQEQLYEGRDLALTTDFRSVFAEVVQDHLGARALDRIFPGFAASPRDFLGVV